MTRSILDDIAALPPEQRAALEAQISAAERQGYLLGMWHTLAWLAALTAVQNGR